MSAVKINVYVGGSEGGKVVEEELRGRDLIRVPGVFDMQAMRYRYQRYHRTRLPCGESVWVLEDLRPAIPEEEKGNQPLEIRDAAGRVVAGIN